jgi:AcrR family transcriptional regulator
VNVSGPVEAAPVTRGARRRGETRRRLLAAARAVFAREGLEAATITQITNEADAGFGTFYLHFATKEDAYRAVVTEGFAELAAALERVRDDAQGAPWYVMTGAAVRAYVEFAARNRELFTVMFAGGGIGLGLGRELSEHFATGIAAQMAASAAEARDQETRPWSYSPMPVAVATVAALTRAILWWLAHEAPSAPASAFNQSVPSDESRELLIATMSRYVTAALWGQLPLESPV